MSNHLSRSRGPVAALVLLTTLAVGCTGVGSIREHDPSGQEARSSSTPQESRTSRGGADLAAYTEPAWMAQTRQEVEQKTDRMVTCLADKGWTVTARPDNSYDIGDLTDEQDEQLGEAEEECLQKVWGPDPVRDSAFWGVKYDRALDTRDCLVAEGHAISDPPGKEAWVEAALHDQDLWTPFQQVIDAAPMDMATYYTLYDTCTQDGPTAGMSR